MDKKKRIIWMLISFVLAGLSIWAVFASAGNISVKSLVSSLRYSKKFPCIIGILSAGGFVVFEGLAISSLLKGVGYRRNPVRGQLYSASDIYFSAVTPSASGGQPASAFFMMQDGIPGGVTAVVLIMNLVLYTISIVVLGVASVVMNPKLFFGFRPFAKALIIAGVIVLGGLTFFFMMLLKKGSVVFRVLDRFIRFLGRKRIVRKPERWKAKLEKAEGDYVKCASMMKGKNLVIIKAFLWNLLQRAAQISVPMWLYYAIHPDKGIVTDIFASQCLINIGFNTVPVPGAMGVADYLMVDGYSSLMETEEAMRLEMLSRGFQFYICVAVSGLFMLICYLIMKKKRGIKVNDRGI